MLPSLNLVPADAVTTEITTSGTSTAGESYTLTCTVTILESLGSTWNLAWQNSSGSLITSESDTTSLDLIFDPLGQSDEGEYTCEVILSSPYLNDNFIDSISQEVTVEGKLTILCHC